AQQAGCGRDDLLRTAPSVEGLGDPVIQQPQGCSECGGTGFSGRSTIAEILLVDVTMDRLILSNSPEHELTRAARAQGMLSMYEMGAARVWRGETTIDEVL